MTAGSGLRRKVRRWTPTRHKLRRVLVDRCDECGHRGYWLDAWHTLGNEDGRHWHRKCIALVQHRTAADERLAILDLICDVWEVDPIAVQSIAELRGQSAPDDANQKNRAWRVMYALEKLRAAGASS